MEAPKENNVQQGDFGLVLNDKHLAPMTINDKIMDFGPCIITHGEAPLATSLESDSWTLCRIQELQQTCSDPF